MNPLHHRSHHFSVSRTRAVAQGAVNGVNDGKAKNATRCLPDSASRFPKTQRWTAAATETPPTKGGSCGAGAGATDKKGFNRCSVLGPIPLT